MLYTTGRVLSCIYVIYVLCLHKKEKSICTVWSSDDDAYVAGAVCEYFLIHLFLTLYYML